LFQANGRNVGGGYLSAGGKTVFQSVFMLTTVQPLATASSHATLNEAVRAQIAQEVHGAAICNSGTTTARSSISLDRSVVQ
jgi:hypothetical protein